ncbi:MAG: tetratricopeptide repeat protein [Gallionella sp.]|nr:tetratricopeptide repeat protein [Gallionella sp.]
MRNETCGDCSHYTVAKRYHADRQIQERHFIAEFDPEVEDAVDNALGLAERGKTDAAWTAMTDLSNEYPMNHSVCYGMGTVHAIKGEYKESVKWFDKAISIFPYFVEAYFNLAVSYQNLFDLGNAIRAYRKVVELGDSNDIPAKEARSFLEDMAASIRQTEGVDLDSYIESQSEFDRAFTLMEQEDWSGALAGFRASAARNNSNAPIYGNMGLCLAKMGYKAQALAALDRAIEIDPQYEPAMTNRIAVELMTEGIPMHSDGFKRIEFGKEKFLAR